MIRPLMGVLAACLAGCADVEQAFERSSAPEPQVAALSDADDAAIVLGPKVVLDAPSEAAREAALPVAGASMPLSPQAAIELEPAGRGPLNNAVRCMTRTIYWEAKGEGEKGMRAVAHVVANRVRAKGFPDDVCGVITAGGPNAPCQFSWYCDGRDDAVREPAPFATAREIARQVINGESRDPTDGATLFHNTTVRPYWAARTTRTAKIGNHIFYRL